jgi:hypothetical protein
MSPRRNQIYAFQDFQIAIRLVKIADLYHRRAKVGCLHCDYDLSLELPLGRQFVRNFSPIATAFLLVLANPLRNLINCYVQSDRVALAQAPPDK